MGPRALSWPHLYPGLCPGAPSFHHLSHLIFPRYNIHFHSALPSISVTPPVPGLPNKSLHKFQPVQNSAAWTTTITRSFHYITPILQQLHWLPVKFGVHFISNPPPRFRGHNPAPPYLSDPVHIATRSPPALELTPFQFYVTQTQFHSSEQNSNSPV